MDSGSSDLLPPIYSLYEVTNDSAPQHFWNTTDNMQVWNNCSTPSLIGTIREDQPCKVDRTVVSIFGNISAVISLIGIICNALNIIVLVKMIRRISNSPIYHLLLAIGVGDLLALIFLATYYVTMFCRWPPILYQDVAGEENPGFIYVLMYLWYFPANMFILSSTWCIVSLTIFRFLAVSFPMKVSQWCTQQRVRLTIVLVFTSAFIVNLPDYLTITFDSNLRVQESKLYDKMSSYNIIYQILEVGLPFTINSILVTCIIRNLYKSRFKISEMIASGYSTAKEKEQRHIGYMLISVVILFIVCSIPQIVYILMRDFSGEGREKNELDPMYQIFSLVSTVMLLINQSANVFFYCLFNKQYRQSFCEIIFRIRKKKVNRPHTTRHGYTVRTDLRQHGQHLNGKMQLHKKGASKPRSIITSSQLSRDLSTHTDVSIRTDFSLLADDSHT